MGIITKETTLADLLPDGHQPVSLFVDVATFEGLLKQAGILSTWDYARDAHFQRWLLCDAITDMDSLVNFLAQLDQAKDALKWASKPAECVKARTIRNKLETAFWSETMGRVLSAVATARRVCCFCHETGSFAERGKR